MAINLVVRVPFWHFTHGDIISDPDEIDMVELNHSHFVTRISVPDKAEEDTISMHDGMDLQTHLGPEKF